MLIGRPYLFKRGRTLRVLAGITVAAAVAGCGAASQQSGTGASTTPVVTPAPAAGGAGAGASVVAQGSSGAAQRANTAAGRLIHQQAQPKLTQGSGTSLSGQVPGVTQGSGTSLGTGSSGQGVSSGATSTPATGSPAPARPSPSRTTSATTPSGASTGSGGRVHTVIRVEKVIERVPVRPDAPLAAFLPSGRPVLTQTAFRVADGNVGCELSAGQLRCSVQRRVWVPPVQPLSCNSGWGYTITLASHGPATFACGGGSAIVPGAKVISNGWDDRLGSYTCEIRSIGVACFSSVHHGLMLSRTGYATY